jgi:signal peptidase I
MLFALFWAIPALAGNATLKERADEAYFHGEYGKAAELYVEYYESLDVELPPGTQNSTLADFLSRIAGSYLAEEDFENGTPYLVKAISADVSIQNEKFVVIRSDYMEPTLLEGDKIFIDDTFYDDFPVLRRDVVFVQNPIDAKNKFVSRIIALPGESVFTKDGLVHVNGELLISEKLASLSDNATAEVELLEITIPEDHYLFLADNRHLDFERRFVGPTHKKYILGKAIGIYSSDADLMRSGTRIH